MSDDKPKHKPQKKHTLSEVLKSLQDLIRTDLVTAPPVAPSAPAAATAPRAEAAPATPAEPDSFNDALDQLDNIITHNIIEPVERAKETPPEPLLPEETLEIEWDDPELLAPAGSEPVEPAAGQVARTPEPSPQPSEETIEIAPAPAAEEPREPSPQTANNVVELEIIQIETKSDNERETIDFDAPEMGSDTSDNVIEFDGGTTDETIELTSLSDDVAPDTIELPPESVAELADANDSRETAKPSAPAPAPAAGPQTNPQQELFATYVSPPEPLKPATDVAKTVPLDTASKAKPASRETGATTSPPPQARKPANEEAKTVPLDTVPKAKQGSKEPQTTLPPPPPVAPAAERPQTTHQPAADTQAEGGHDIPSLTIDFDVTQLSATPDDATAAKMAETPPAGQERAPAEPAQPKTQKTRAPAAEPPRARSPEAVKETKNPPARAMPKAAEPATKAAAPQDIPVLKEVANLDAPPSEPLPNPGQARDIAIRVIAKLNIERRKAGEAPLDIKTIEKLQQYLADALNKRTLNKPK